MKNALPPGEALNNSPSEQQAIAQLLWERISFRYPFLKRPDLSKWAAEIEKIHRLDGKGWDVIMFVAEWSQNDPFWRQQIRSGANLRKHFETMMIKVYEEKQTKPQVFKI